MENVAGMSEEVNGDEHTDGSDLGADGPAQIVPDRAETERFLALLDPRATKFTFQAFDDDATRKAPRLTQILHGSLDGLWERLVELNQRGAGIFVTVNETDGKGRKVENITRVRGVYQDDDKAHGWTAGLPPSIAVNTSPTKHQRWLLADDLSAEDYAAAMGAMIADHGNDRTAKTWRAFFECLASPIRRTRTSPIRCASLVVTAGATLAKKSSRHCREWREPNRNRSSAAAAV